jgi:hypothetical protein
LEKISSKKTKPIDVGIMISVINKRFFPVFTSLNVKKILSKKTNIDLNEYRIKLFLG